MKLLEIRATYPEFKDASDEELARAIHTTHFAHEDFETFSKAIGYSAPDIREAPEDIQRVAEAADRAQRTPAKDIAQQIGPPIAAGPATKGLADFGEEAMKAPSGAEQSFEPSTMDKLMQAGMAVDRNFVKTIATMPKALALAETAIDKYIPDIIKYSMAPNLMLLPEEDKEVFERSSYELGEHLITLSEMAWPEDPQMQHTFLTKALPEGFGSMFGFLGIGLATAGLGTPTWVGSLLAGASLESANAYDEAKRYGASEEDAMWTALIHVPIGATEAIPIARAFKRLNRVSGGLIKRAVIQAGQGAIEEGVQEGVQQLLGNATFKAQYDKDRKLLEGVGTGVGAGGIIGAVMNLVMAGLPGPGLEIPPTEEAPIITPEEAREILQKADVTEEVVAPAEPGKAAVTEPKAKTFIPAAIREQLEAKAKEPTIAETIAELKKMAEESFVRKKEDRPHTLFHATAEDFAEFKPKELGVHLGTKGQAEEVAQRIGKGAKVLTVEADIKNPLLMEDLASWDPTDVADELLEYKTITQGEYDNWKAFWNATNDAYAKKEITGDELETRLYDYLKNQIKEKGYDGIVYENQEEGKGETFIAFDSEQVKIVPVRKPEVAPGEAIAPEKKEVPKKVEKPGAAPVVEAPTGAGAASVEAISRQKQGQYAFFDTRTGTVAMDKSVDAPDRAVSPYQMKAWVDNKGEVSITDYGSKILPIRKNVLKREFLSKIEGEIAKAEKKEARVTEDIDKAHEAPMKKEKAEKVFAESRERVADMEKKASDWVKAHGKVAFEAFTRARKPTEAQKDMVKHGELPAEALQPRKVLVTKSAKQPGDWQATFFEGGKPISDIQRKNYEKMIYELEAEWSVDIGAAKPRIIPKKEVVIEKPITPEPEVKPPAPKREKVKLPDGVILIRGIDTLGNVYFEAEGQLDKAEKWMGRSAEEMERLFKEHKEIEKPPAKEPWEMTAKEYAAGPVVGVGKKQIRAERLGMERRHATIIQQALSEGKPVPKEVLADYPDLGKLHPTTIMEAELRAKKKQWGKEGEVSPERMKGGLFAEERKQVGMEFEEKGETPKEGLKSAVLRKALDEEMEAAEADALEILQSKMKALADAHESETVPEALSLVTSRAEIETLTWHDKFPRGFLRHMDARNAEKYAAGTKGLGADLKIIANLRGTYAKDDFIEISPGELDAVERVLRAAQKKGDTGARYALDDLAQTKRMRKIGITNQKQYDAAKEALATIGKEKPSAPTAKQEIAELERGLIGVKIPGFFSTPKATAETMVGMADISPGATVLEPSAGKGNIAEVIREAHPDADLKVIEWNNSLRGILEKKDFNVAGSDFFEHFDHYDRIIQNPPFEKLADIDHVRHAFALLKPGGKLISIMGESSFFREDEKASEFRAWLKEFGGVSEKLPEKTFIKEATTTGAAGRIVTMEKPVQPGGQKDPTSAKTLIEWVRDMGGVWDPSVMGETREFLPQQSGVRGLVRKTGRAWDDLVDDAIASGWLSEGSSDVDLREALRTDIAAAKFKRPRLRSMAWTKTREAEMKKELDNEFDQRQAMLDEGAQEASNEFISFMGTGMIPKVAESMVKDMLHHTGIKDIDPEGITVNPKDLRNIYTYLQMPDDIRRTFPEFDPVYQIERARAFEREVLNTSFAQATEPYFNLGKKDLAVVDATLLEGERSGQEMFSEEELKEQFDMTEAQIKGYTAIRHSLNQARDMLLQKMRDFELDEDTVKDFESTTKGYVPHKWYGDWINVVKDKGKTVFMTGTNFIDRYTERARLRKLYPGKDVITIKRKEIPYEAYQDAPPFAVQKLVDLATEKVGLGPDMKEAMDEALSDLYKSKGFGMHFIQRKGIPGYTETLGRPLAEYFTGFSGYLTKMDAVQAFPKAIQNIRINTNLFRYTTEYIKYVTGEQFEFSTMKSLAYTYYLWGNLKSASLNLTQNFVLGWAVLSKHTNFSLAKLNQAMARTATGTLTKGEKAFIEDLRAGGYLNPKMSQEISGYVGNPMYKKIMGPGKKAMTMLDIFRHAEAFNRKSMAVALYDSGIRDVEKAAELIEEAHFHYAKGNRPRLARGLLSPIMTFRSWGINYMLWLKRQIKEGEIGAVSRSLFALMIFGGMAAFPLWDQFKKLYTQYFGIDPETDIREVLGQRLGRNLVHGLPAEIGVEFSGSVGVGDMLPTNMADAGGVFMDFVPHKGSRVNKVYKDIMAGDEVRALEDAAPEFIRNPMAAYRMYKKGATSRGGRPVLDLKTGKQLRYEKGEVIRKSLGYYPIGQAEQYGLSDTIRTIKDQRNERKRTWADRYRIAYLEGDKAEQRKVADEIIQWNGEMKARGRPEDQISNKEMRTILRTRARAVGKPPKYMMPKLRRLKEQYD